MIGILTEKPSASRNFAKALGGMKGTYKGESYVIVAARGHLYEFVYPEKQVPANLTDKYKRWSVDALPWDEKDFSWKRQMKKGASSTLNTIKKELASCDEIVIGSDVDPSGEGQLLAWEILEELKLKPKKYSRMYFTDEAATSIQKAFVERKALLPQYDDPEFLKSDYRTKFDFLSMQFTRIATLLGDGSSVLRQGRLKSAMVSLTGDGLKAVSEYKKIPFYSNRFRDENGNVFVSKEEPLFKTKEEVSQSYENSDIVIDKKERKFTAPPKLFDLSDLSSRLSGKGVKADDVLTVYQKMYEDQVVSYPRTEDKFITPDQFAEMLPLINDIAGVVGVDISLLTHQSPRKTHVKTGGAHGANRPGLKVPSSLASLKSYGACAPMIYEILAKNYLAMLCEDYEYELQSGHLGKYPEFKGSASIPKKQGYKLVFSGEEDDEDVAKEGLKALGDLAKPFIYEGFPPKPPIPTMKWLMTQLSKHDVGTGATKTSTYAEVTKPEGQYNKYPLLKETKGKITMTKYGDMSYYLLKDTNIGDVKLTEELMIDMRLIANKELDPNQALKKIAKYVEEDIKTMTLNGNIMRKDLNITMTKNTGSKEKCTGEFEGKEVSFNRTWGGHKFTDEECNQLLAGEEIDLIDLTSAKGNKYSVRGKLGFGEGKYAKVFGFQKSEFL